MSGPSHIYRLLQDACRLLDGSSDHAIAAYVGLAMTLVENKYGICLDDANVHDTRLSDIPSPAARSENGGSWA